MLQQIIDYFQTIPSLHRALIVAGGITIFWIIEGAIPLFKFGYHKWKHAGLNIFFTVTTILVNFSFALIIALTSLWCLDNNFGIIYWLHLPLWAAMVIGILVMDLIGAYFIHFIQHKIKWMWMFHLVHHADMQVDITTANRHHPGESVFRAVFTLLAVFITGAPLWLIMLYQTLSAIWSQFTHANISLPTWIDKAMSFVLVSPNMHKVHHHYVRPQTDSNFGNIFSIWDRLFGTFQYFPVKDIKFGVDVMEGRNVQSLSGQLKVPFDKSIKTDY